jgi:hypothetical protein
MMQERRSSKVLRGFIWQKKNPIVNTRSNESLISKNYKTLEPSNNKKKGCKQELWWGERYAQSLTSNKTKHANLY